MLLILVALIVVMALAALVTALAAFPERGQQIPHAPRVTNQINKIRDRILP
jgi:hypothetical protein